MPGRFDSDKLGSKTDFFTQDFTKKETWYQQSIKVEDEVLSTTDNLVFTPPSPGYWIDASHFKLKDEHKLTEYIPIITSGGVTKTEHSPEKTDHDYSIDYTTGTVTFLSEQTGEVKATYHYPTSSLFVVKPKDNETLLKVNFVEILYSKDIILNDTLIVQAFGPVELVAPQYLNNPYPGGTMLPLNKGDRFATIYDLAVDAEKSYPPLPVFHGSTGIRHNKNELYTMRFDYESRNNPNKLYGSKGFELWIWLKDHIPYGGEIAVGTFYCLELPEYEE